MGDEVDELSYWSLNHTYVPGECDRAALQDLASGCDAYWTMTVAGYMNLDRAELALNWEIHRKRVAHRIEGLLLYIQEMRELQSKLKCQACISDINLQIKFQTRGIDDLRRRWDL